MKNYITIIFLLLLISCSKVDQSVVYNNINYNSFYKDKKQVELLSAISKEDLNKIDKLIDKGVDINGVGENLSLSRINYMTPLMWAIFKKKKKSYLHLLKRGANPNGPKNKIRYAPLFKAAENLDSFYLEHALKHGGDPNLKSGSTTPLHLTFMRQGYSIKNAKLLIDAGADINETNVVGNNQLVIAIRSYNFEMALFLLENGADYKTKKYDIISIISNKFVLDKSQYEWKLKVIKFLESKGFQFKD